MAVSPLTVSDSALKVANAALNALGTRPIADFTENTIAARTLNACYADVLEQALSSYPWRFARKAVPLTAHNDPPPAPWAYAWVWPATALSLHAVKGGGVNVDFDRFEGMIVTNEPDVVAEVTRTPAASAWPGYFRRALVKMLASEIALTIVQDPGTAQVHAQTAKLEMQMAKSRDAQNRTSTRLDTSLILRSRRGGIGRMGRG